MKTIDFDPRVFISPPYSRCPKCGEPESFGVLMVCSNQYVRKCTECSHKSTFSLPRLSKKIVYIDQFAVSEMMKALNPSTKPHRRGTLRDFWATLFESLDTLCKLQLIVCPESDFHTDESLLSASWFGELKRMYQLLSCGVSFYDHETIRRFQIYEHAKVWAAGNGDEPITLNAADVVTGDMDGWQDRFIFSVNPKYDNSFVDELRANRDNVHEGLSQVFQRWQREGDRTFWDWFEDEARTFGPATLQSYLEYLKAFSQKTSGRMMWTADDLLFPPCVDLVYSVQRAFEKAGIERSDMWPKTFQYFMSPSLKEVPFIKISSMLWAALARKAAAGQRKPPTQGMANDVRMVSVLLPYCDAMFVDRECHAYLKEKPLCDSLDYGTQVFSTAVREEFLQYLAEIKSSASKEQFEKVAEVYGVNWPQPYTTLYREPKE